MIFTILKDVNIYTVLQRIKWVGMTKELVLKRGILNIESFQEAYPCIFLFSLLGNFDSFLSFSFENLIALNLWAKILNLIFKKKYSLNWFQITIEFQSVARQGKNEKMKGEKLDSFFFKLTRFYFKMSVYV